jgi:hypothetical protein
VDPGARSEHNILPLLDSSLPVVQNHMRCLHSICLNEGAEILSMSDIVEGATVHLVIGQANGVISRFDCTEDLMKDVWAKQFSSSIPRTVAFRKEDDKVVAFGLLDGMEYGSPSSICILLTSTQ